MKYKCNCGAVFSNLYEFDLHFKLGIPNVPAISETTGVTKEIQDEAIKLQNEYYRTHFIVPNS